MNLAFIEQYNTAKYGILASMIFISILLMFGISKQDLASDGNGNTIVKHSVNWILEHLVPYQFTKTYESEDYVYDHGPINENAIALRCFDVPASNSVYLYTSQYGRAHLYDTSLAIILLSLDGRYNEARNLLITLQHLQNSDGSIGFSWNSSIDNFYNRSYIRAGALSWTGYAAVVFQRESGKKEFQHFAEKIAAYIISLQITDENDIRYGLIRGGSGRWLPDGKTLIIAERQEWCATEHCTDSFFFLQELGYLTGKKEYTDAANKLKHGILASLWNENEGRFNAAIDSYKVNSELVLDSCSWGSIFLTAIGEREKAQLCLDFVEENFPSVVGDVKGYKAYSGNYSDHPIADWGKIEMVWSEGSLGVAMAYLKLGNYLKANEIVNQMLKMKDKNGGIKYSIYDDEILVPSESIKAVDGKPRTDKIEDFIREASASGTIWLGLVEYEMANLGQQKFWSGYASEK